MSLIASLVASSILFLALGLQRMFGRSQNYLERRLGIKQEQNILPIPAVKTKVQQNAPASAFLTRLEAAARKAGINTTGRALILSCAAIVATAIVAGYVLTNQLIIACALGVVGLLLPEQWFKYQQHRRYQKFIRKFDAALMLAASALKAGASAQQAFEEVAKKGPEAVALEFEKVVHAMNLGAAPGDAVKILQDEIEGPEVEMFVMATQILTKSGGNLAELYSGLASRIAENKSFREAMKAQTAESRITAIVISIMPFALTGLMLLANPAYFAPFTSSTVGKFVLGLCYFLIIVGWFIIRKILEVQVD